MSPPPEAEPTAVRLALLEQAIARLQREDRKREEDLEKLSERIDRLTLAVVGFALTLAVFGLGIAATLLTTRAH